MAKIESIKTYTGQDLPNIFFRPMLQGENAIDLGFKVMYNTPTPTTLHFWQRSGNVLQKFTEKGFNGAAPATKFQKVMDLKPVKAELAFGAADYFGSVYELLTNTPGVNMDDLSGTDLEKAETELFKQNIAESIRVTAWIGDTSKGSGFNAFNGILPSIVAGGEVTNHKSAWEFTDSYTAADLLAEVYAKADDVLKQAKGEGQLAFFVTSDVYEAYEKYLMTQSAEAAFAYLQGGVKQPTYNGIPVIDMKISGYIADTDLPESVVLLTDRRNLALAVNTANYPDAEVKMWYSNDQMENRQRALFLAGADYLLPELISYAAKA